MQAAPCVLYQAPETSKAGASQHGLPHAACFPSTPEEVEMSGDESGTDPFSTVTSSNAQPDCHAQGPAPHQRR